MCVCDHSVLQKTIRNVKKKGGLGGMNCMRCAIPTLEMVMMLDGNKEKVYYRLSNHATLVQCGCVFGMPAR